MRCFPVVHSIQCKLLRLKFVCCIIRSPFFLLRRKKGDRISLRRAYCSNITFQKEQHEWWNVWRANKARPKDETCKKLNKLIVIHIWHISIHFKFCLGLNICWIGCFASFISLHCYKQHVYWKTIRHHKCIIFFCISLSFEGKQKTY